MGMTIPALLSGYAYNLEQDKKCDWIPIVDVIVHLLMWIGALVSEAVFQNEFGTLTALDTLVSPNLVQVSATTFAISLVTILVLIGIGIFDIKTTTAPAFLGGIIVSFLHASLCFNIIQAILFFVNFITVAPTASLIHSWLAVIVLKFYLCGIVKINYYLADKKHGGHQKIRTKS